MYSQDLEYAGTSLGRSIGFEFARLGVRLPEECPAVVLEGFREGQHQRRGRAFSTPYERKLLRLKLSAFKRGRAVDENVTPAFLEQIAVAYCPITRREMTSGTGTDSDATVDRVFNDAAYAVGNLAMMSMKANQAKGTLLPSALLELAGSGSETRGLSSMEWMRLACLASISAPDDCKHLLLPMYVFPPRLLALTNPNVVIQLATTMLAAGMQSTKDRAAYRAQLSGKQSKRRFDAYLHALAAQAQAMVLGHGHPDLRQFAFCGCWENELVWQRFQEFMVGCTDAEKLGLCAIARRASRGNLVQDKTPFKNWAVETGGYAP